MNISRTAFYHLVKMQNHLIDLCSETTNLSEAIKDIVFPSIIELEKEIKSLTTTYLAEVDMNRQEDQANKDWWYGVDGYR